MKNIFRPLCAFLTVVMAVSCQQEDLLPSIQDSQEAQPHLVDATQVSVSSAGDALVQAIESAESLLKLNSQGSLDEGNIMKLFKGEVTGVEWQFETYRITYTTKDAGGNDIELSGDVCFLSEASNFVKRRLSTVTLFNNFLGFDDNSFDEFNSSMSLGNIVMPVRALYNALVVCPHFQGAGTDKGKHQCTPAESMLRARQAIDCELAALEFIEQTDNISMEDNYYTEAMGVGNGGSTSVAIEYILETNKSYAEASRMIRLKGTYCGEGWFDCHKAFLNLISKEMTGNTMLSSFGPYISMSMILGAYDTWTEDFTSNGIDKVNDFFSPAFNNIKVYYQGDNISLIDYMRAGEFYYSGSEDNAVAAAGLGLRTMINPNIFVPVEGTVKPDINFIQALFAAQNHDVQITYGWSPASAMRIVHSSSDEFVSIDIVKEMQRELGWGSFNTNFKLETISGTGHVESALKLFARDILGKRHPAQF